MSRPSSSPGPLLVLAAAVALSACASRKTGTPDNEPTLKVLAGRSVEVGPDSGIKTTPEQTIAAYKKFLEIAPKAAQRPEAMRRIGDLEMDSADNRLADGGGTTDWTASYADSNSVLAAAAAGLADRLAQRYAIPTMDRQPGDYQLWIADVRSPLDYGNALNYLENLSVVGSITPIGADGDRLLVQAHLEVTLDRLRQLLALQDVLQFDDTAEAVGAQATLRLRH